MKHNDIKCVQGEGMPAYKQPFEKGLLIIQFQVCSGCGIYNYFMHHLLLLVKKGVKKNTKFTMLLFEMYSTLKNAIRLSA